MGLYGNFSSQVNYFDVSISCLFLIGSIRFVRITSIFLFLLSVYHRHSPFKSCYQSLLKGFLRLDITVFSDVSRNPGPQVLPFEPTTRTYVDLHIVSSRPMISYSRNELFKIRRVSHCSPSEWIFVDLRRAGLLHLRGCRAGRRDFIHGIKVIASNRSEVDGPRYAPCLLKFGLIEGNVTVFQ